MAKKKKQLQTQGPYQYDRTRVLVDIRNAVGEPQSVYAEHVDFEGPIVRFEVGVLPELIAELQRMYDEAVRLKLTKKKKS